MRDALIRDRVRVPIGRCGGALAGVRTDDLAVTSLCGLLSRNPGLDPAAISDATFGCTNQADEGNRDVAYMTTLLADYPYSVPGITTNRLCGPGLNATGFTVRAIKAGDVDLPITGGVESISHVLFVMGKAGALYQRQSELFDTTIGWCFVNPLVAQHFGTGDIPETTENVTELLNISRADRDTFVWRSQQRMEQTQYDGILAREIVPVQIIGEKGTVSAVRDDEHPHPETMLEQLTGLEAPFRQGGVITAGSASGVNDGAVALIIASKQQTAIQGLTPRTHIVAMATAGIKPHLMGLGPIPAVHKVLGRVGLSVSDMDLIELNEAFAAQVLGVPRQFGVPNDAAHMNPNGSAITLGHPLGMSDVWLALSASLGLQCQGGRYALYTMCTGVGQGIVMILE